MVIIREDLIGHSIEGTPTMFQYDIHVKNGSMYNTPPTYAIYVCMKVLEWLDGLGGLAAIGEINRRKAGKLYDYLDSSKLFKPTVMGRDRSLMNVPFVTGDADKDAAFCEERRGRGACQPEGAPLRRRYAREHLQRHAGRRRRGADSLYDGF